MHAIGLQSPGKSYRGGQMNKKRKSILKKGGFLLYILMFSIAVSCVTKNNEIAELRRTAEQGDIDAQAKLGMMYYLGKGVPKDYTEAFTWLSLAAEQGNSSAQTMLGSMYEFSDGVPQDYVSAYMYYNLAAANGETSARELCDWLATKMTADQIAEAQRRAHDWAPKTWEELHDQ